MTTNATDEDDLLLAAAAQTLAGDWRRQGGVVELSLDGTPGGDGIELEQMGFGIGIHVHITVQAEDAARVLRAIGGAIGLRPPGPEAAADIDPTVLAHHGLDVA